MSPFNATTEGETVSNVPVSDPVSARSVQSARLLRHTDRYVWRLMQPACINDDERDEAVIRPTA
jgi:hypothetical protein